VEGLRVDLLNPRASIELKRQGDEGQPVLVIDDFLANPDGWREAASRAAFGRIGPFYPGLRSAIPPAAASALREGLAGPIGEAFGLDPVPGLLECFFSIVTTPPASLAPIQRLPHFDGLEPERIAILVYLSGAEQGGTAFYRQRATGFETVDQARFPAFEAALKAGVAEHGLPPAGYIDGDTPLYQEIARYEARPNRALVYRGHSLHCAAIPAGADLSVDPRRGRLSVNAFLFDAPASP
jgi:hypothetical protein